MIRKFLVLVATIVLGVSAAPAAVTLTFDSGTDGFITSNGGVISNDASRLKIVALGGGEYNEPTTRAATLTFTPESAIGNEMTMALTKGGTISFDFSLPESGLNWAGPDRSESLEIQLTVGSGYSHDTETKLVSIPTFASTTDGHFRVAILPGVGNHGAGTNGTIYYKELGSRSFSVGIRDRDELLTNATIFIDNFTVSAVAIPEPSCFAGLAAAGLVGTVIARKRTKS